MRFTYDTETDSISVSNPDLGPQETAAIQTLLSRALYRNDPIQDVARLLLETAKSSSSQE